MLMENGSVVLRRNKRRRRWLTFLACIVALAALFAVPTFADEVAPAAEVGAHGMSDLVGEIFESFTTVISGLSDGLKTAFVNLIYVDPAATSPTFSPLVIFAFTMAGIGLATGILYKIFSMVKRRG